MIKLIGPFLLVLVLIFFIASFWLHALLPAITVAIVLGVLGGTALTFFVDLKDYKRREGEAPR